MPAYRLQTLLEIKERAEEDAKQAFSVASQALAKARAELKRLQDDLERRRNNRRSKVEAHLKEVMAKGAGIGSMSLMNRFEERLKDEEAAVELDIDRQKEVVKAAEKVLEQRRREMAEAATERKAMDKHKEKWTAQVKKEREGREEMAQEEIGNALYLARTRKRMDSV